MIDFLSAGVALGLYAGFSPGPLLTVLLSQAIKYGPKEGIKVAFAPIITDLPIVLFSTLLLVRLSDFKLVLGVVSILGGVFLVYLAYAGIRTKRVEVNIEEETPHSFMKGAIVNALSPNPYLFWITIGGPTIIKGLAESYILPALFVGTFLGCLVGSKVLVAVIAGKSKHFMTGRPYIYIMRALGIMLLAFAVILFRDGLRLLK